MSVVKQGDNFIIRNVPIFDEHEDYARPANLQQVNSRTLEKILHASQKRLETEYELPVAWDDKNKHTPLPGERHAPPPVRGGYRNLRIDDFHGRKAIFADVRVPASEYPSLEGYQRRSVEILPDELAFDTLVLLGSKTPARDLGPLTPRAQYSRDGREVVRYEMAATYEPHEFPKETPMPDMEQPVDGTIGSMGQAEFMQMLTGAFKSALDEVMNSPEADPDGDGIPNAEDAQPDMFNDEPPAEEAPLPEGDPTDDKEKEMYARHDLSVKYERQAKELETVKAELATIATRERKERYEKQVEKLQFQGYAISKEKEMARLMKFADDATRDEYMEGLKENGKRIPSVQYGRGGNPESYDRSGDPVQYEPAAGDRDPRTGELTPDQAFKAREFAIANKTTYEAGRAHVLANGKA